MAQVNIQLVKKVETWDTGDLFFTDRACESEDLRMIVQRHGKVGTVDLNDGRLMYIDDGYFCPQKLMETCYPHAIKVTASIKLEIA